MFTLLLELERRYPKVKKLIEDLRVLGEEKKINVKTYFLLDIPILEILVLINPELTADYIQIYHGLLRIFEHEIEELVG